MAYIDVKHESKRYQMGETVIKANDDISFSVDQGKLTVILGPSGAGKSTLLNILGGMDSPSGGEIIVDGTDIAKFNEKQLTTYRRNDVGFVFQFYNLIPNLTTVENVELATAIVPDALDPTAVLREVGLAAIARALAKNPKLLLCDEPTGALDYETGKQVLSLLQDASRQDGKTVMIITHNSAIAKMADRVIRINDARVRSVVDNDQPTPVSKIVW